MMLAYATYNQHVIDQNKFKKPFELKRIYGETACFNRNHQPIIVYIHLSFHPTVCSNRNNRYVRKHIP